jgi:hypothetical protein
MSRYALVLVLMIAVLAAAGVGYIAPHPPIRQTGFQFPTSSFNSCIASVRVWFPKMRTLGTAEERAIILLSQNSQCLSQSGGVDYIGLADVFRLTGVRCCAQYAFTPTPRPKP